MTGLITAADLLARSGFDGLGDVEATTLIDDASALVRDAASPLLDDVASPDAPAAVVAVVVSMIRRGWVNPVGHQSESLGDYAYTAGTQGGVATLYLTARERKIVRRAVGKLGAGSISMSVNLPDQISDGYCGTGLGEDIVL